MGHHAVYQIQVDGKDVTSNFDPILISLEIQSDDDQNADELTIELDDTGGQIVLPRKGAQISASIGWSDTGAVTSFGGTVDESHSGGKGPRGHRHGGHRHGGHHGGLDAEKAGGSRGAGRTLTITAKSVDMGGKAKQRVEDYADNKSFSDAATQFAKTAGLTVKVDQALASVQRAYWAISHESYLAWGARMARELGATFKVFGLTGVFAKRAGGTSVSGQALAGITAAWGVNLISWDIAPDLSRPSYGSASTRYYDPVGAKWGKGKGTQTAASGDDDAEHGERFKKPDEDQANDQSDANAAEIAREKGAGTITIDGDPDAQPGAPLALTGARPGVDGVYLISRASHSLSRGSGYITSCGVKQPSGDAGSDTRQGTSNNGDQSTSG